MRFSAVMKKHQALAALAAVVLSASSASAATWYVNNDAAITTRNGLTPGTAFATVAAAFTAASAGDTIEIAGGPTTTPYRESITVNKANLTFVGTGSAKPVIRAANGAQVAVFRVNADGLKFDNLNFYIRHAYEATSNEQARVAITNLIANNGSFFTPTNNAATQGTFNGLVVEDSDITFNIDGLDTETLIDPAGGTGGPASVPTGGFFAFRRVGVYLAGGSAGLGSGDTATIQRNRFDRGVRENDGRSTSYLSHGIFIVGSNANFLIDDNDIGAETNGFMARDVAGGTITVSNNRFTGSNAFDISGGLSPATINFNSNTFSIATFQAAWDQRAGTVVAGYNTTTGDRYLIALQGGYVNGQSVASQVNFTGNTFNAIAKEPSFDVSGGPYLAGYPASVHTAGQAAPANGTVFTNNIFNSAPGVTDFTHIMVDAMFASARDGSSTVASTGKVTIRGNTFNTPASATGTQTAIGIYARKRSTDGATPGFPANGIVIGGSGTENTFNTGYDNYLSIATENSSQSYGTSTILGIPVNTSVDLRDNNFAVGGSPKAPSAMSDAELSTLNGLLRDRLDSTFSPLSSVGVLRVRTGEVFAGTADNLSNAIASLGAFAGDNTLRLGNGTYSLPAGVTVDRLATIQAADGTVFQGPGGGSGFAVNSGSFNVAFNGGTFQSFGAAINAGSGSAGRTINITGSTFQNNTVSVLTAGGNTVNATLNSFISAGTGHFQASAQFTALNVANNLFYDNDAYFTGGTATEFLSPAPNFNNNWYGNAFDKGAGPYTAAPVTINTAGSNQQGVTDAQAAGQFDRDTDGIPDVWETPLLGTATTAYNDTDTDNNNVADGAEGLGFANATDTDGDGYTNWYEVALGFSHTSSASRPSLGDVNPVGASAGIVDLSDAVRALQLVNNTIAPFASGSNPDAVNVTGGAPSFRLTNALQILRFQSGSRQSLPAVLNIP